MAKQLYFEELDETTQDYLHRVRRRHGEGIAGVFIGSSNWLPWIGMILGLVVVAATLWFTVPPLGDPLRMTMLQVAGLLFGGWLIVAAVRVWAAAGSRHYLGHFVFADASYLYEASGPVVNISKLDTIVSASGTENSNDGAYQNTEVTLDFTKKQHTLTVADRQKAADLIAFCTALGMLRGGEESRNLSPAVLGRVALAMVGLAPPPDGGPEVVAADDDRLPPAQLADDEEDDQPRRRDRSSRADEEDAPPRPKRTAMARSGIIAYLVIVVLAIGGVFILKPINAAWHDNAWYSLVKDQDPPELRAYLLDPHCTRHRDKVTELLAGFYQPVAERISREAGADAQVGPEFIRLVNDLQGALQPFVSVSVKEEAGPQLMPDAIRTGTAERQLTDALYKVFTYRRAQDSRHVAGNKLVDTVKPPGGAKPMLEIVYRFEATDRPWEPCPLTWTVRLRHKVTQEDVKTATWTVGSWPQQQFRMGVEEGIRQTVQKLTGRPQWGT